jgi:hypothetical protein
MPVLHKTPLATGGQIPASTRVRLQPLSLEERDNLESKVLRQLSKPVQKLAKLAHQKDKQFLENPSRHRRYFENFLMSARDFPSGSEGA